MYVVDSRYFDGTIRTSMSDGICSDYSGRTIEQIREQDDNPHLIAVSDSRVKMLVKRYENALQTPFTEITEERYYELMDCVPPIRLTKDYFFVGEGYYSHLNALCFKFGGRFYEGLRSIYTPEKELYEEINDFGKVISHRAELIKDEPFQTNDVWRTQYYFADRFGNKFYVGHSDKFPDDKDSKFNRDNLAQELMSLRKNNYQYLMYYGKYHNIIDLFAYIRNGNRTIFCTKTLFKRRGDYVEFRGYLTAPYEPFSYHIYDREVVRQIINQLRRVKREAILKTLGEIVAYLEKFKTYNEVDRNLQNELGFTLRSYGDLDKNKTAQATYVKDKYVIWAIYEWCKVGRDSYVSGDMIRIDYYEND